MKKKYLEKDIYLQNKDRTLLTSKVNIIITHLNEIPKNNELVRQDTRMNHLNLEQ